MGTSPFFFRDDIMLNRGLDKQELLRIVEAVANEKSIDKELVIELRKRAIDEYEKQQKEIDDKNSLTNLDDLTDDQVTLLRNSDILTIDDIADLSIDELLDIIDISNETAGKVIMQARESWFDEENDGQR